MLAKADMIVMGLHCRLQDHVSGKPPVTSPFPFDRLRGRGEWISQCGAA